MAVPAAGQREITAMGSGLNAVGPEQGGFVNQMRSGDFQMAVRIWTLTGTPAAAVMLRDDTAATARFAAVQIAANGSLSIWSRDKAGGSVSSSVAAGNLALPNAWLLVDRRGDRINLAVSSDDVSYTSVGSVELPGLAQTVYAGAFLGGGPGGAAAKAVIGDCEFTAITGAGLTGEYFGDPGLSTLRFSRKDAAVDFNWALGSPDPRLAVDNFSARWTGRIKTQAAGLYTFYTQSDDGVRLWLNGQLVINNWTDHALSENSVSLQLGAGVSVDVRMEYYERGLSAVARLLWATPGQPKQVIPNNALQTP
jgi:hypothetical protein